jgi:phospholipase/lecithinase/hemolysin
VFDKACESAPADYWLSDGVHPTEAGHALIAKLWSEKFNQMQ